MIAIKLGRAFERVTVEPDWQPGGKPSLGHTVGTPPIPVERWEEIAYFDEDERRPIEDEIVVLYAGEIAEARHVGEDPDEAGADDDYRKIDLLVRALDLPLDEQVPYTAALRARAEQLVDEHREEIERLAVVLDVR